MAKNNNTVDTEARKRQKEYQNKEIQKTLQNIKNKILVMSGKGGVGKSSVAAYLSVILAHRGYKVGLMDIDLHGPSIPRILGLKGQFQFNKQERKALPVRCFSNLEVVSIETMLGKNKDAATIWRGPFKISAIKQFISDIKWPYLDYLIIDSPPGTGDEPLTVAQTIPGAMALIVTTPQEVALADVRKSINFCRQVKMEIVGLVENMSGLKCPHCGERIDVFKRRGGEITAIKEKLRLLAVLPLELDIVNKGDVGDISFLKDNNRQITQGFNKIADKIEFVIQKS